MAKLSDLPLSLRLFLRTYPWRRIDPVPWAAPAKPLAESKIAVVSTAGLVLPSQESFDDTVRGGDWSYRELPHDADLTTLRETHRSESFDHTGLRADANLGMPLDRVRELVAAGEIGSINDRHFSLMGSITAPGRLMHESAPTVAAALSADAVDAVLLVPV
jgi:D-proline reductase (dithiol) PrdB